MSIKSFEPDNPVVMNTAISAAQAVFTPTGGLRVKTTLPGP